MKASIGARDAVTLAATAETIVDGHVLHVRADRLPGRRSPHRNAMPSVDLTVGPDARGGFLVVDYSRVRCGEEDRHQDIQAAVTAVRRLLGWDRLRALRSELVRIHGEPEKSTRWLEDLRAVERGARLRGAYGHKPGITGPLFGPSGHGTPRWARR